MAYIISPMTEADINERLRPGAIVTHRATGDSFVVVARHGQGRKRYLSAVRHVSVSNPSEWMVYDPEPEGDG